MTSLRVWSEADEARMWLVCLPPGGGGAHLYQGWAARLPAALGVVALELPGHESRSDETPAADAETLVTELAADVAPLLVRPVVLFGHSMGAVLALDIAHRLRTEYGKPPVALIAAASDPPESPVPADLPDAWLEQQLRDWGGTSAELLADRQYVAELVALLRADFRLIAGRVPAPAAPLDIPIHVYLGADDDGVAPDAADGWARHTRAARPPRTFAGGHFFTADSIDAVLDALVADADAAVGGRLGTASGAATR